MTDSRIVTVGPPLVFRQQVARALGKEPDSVEWVPTVAAVEESMQGGRQGPHVVVLSPAIKDPDAYGLAEFVGRTSPATAVLLVRDRAPNGILPAAMRSGIRDVVDLSKGSEDLRDALARAIAWSESLRFVGREGGSEAGELHGKIFSVFSSKGGTGKTFLACNLATALAVQLKQNTAVIDLDLDLGDLFAYFGKEPAHALQDLIPMGERGDREAILGVGTEFHPHLRAYGSPHDPTMSGLGGEAMGTVLRTLRATFDFVVVDATAEYSDAALAAFDLSDQILMIASLDVVGIRHLSLDLQTLLSLGFPADRFRLILNRADSKVGLSPADVDRVLNAKVDTLVPSSRLVPISLNQGRPLVLEEPKSEVAKSIQMLARRLAETPAVAQGRGRVRTR